jgi:hypothetical protein
MACRAEWHSYNLQKMLCGKMICFHVQIDWLGGKPNIYFKKLVIPKGFQHFDIQLSELYA